MERKRISISSKRQVTIPQKYFDALGFDSEAECILQDNAIILRPVKSSGGEFAEQILEDLIEQGYSGKELLSRFKECQRQIRPSVEQIIAEADNMSEDPGYSMISLDELFGGED